MRRASKCLSGISCLNHISISAITKVLSLCLSVMSTLSKVLRALKEQALIKELKRRWKRHSPTLRVCYNSLCNSSLRARKTVWTITLTLEKQVSLLTSPKDRGWKDEGLESRAPPRPAQETPRPSALPLQRRHLITLARCNGLHMPRPFLLLLLQYVLLCQSDVGSRAWGNTFQGEMHTCTFITHTHSHTRREVLAEQWIVRERYILHETNLDSSISPN